jgi:hypothetical protein
MIDIKQFSALEKSSKNSFVKQKQIMKKVMAGQTVLCSKCQQSLFLFTPGQNEIPGIRCNKGCTDLQLDFA